jgi:flagellin
MISLNSVMGAYGAANNLGSVNKELLEILEQLSTGYRINSAADDPAGLAVWTNLNSQQVSTRQAVRNANTGISVAQTAESAYDEVADLLTSMRSLAVQSASETLTTADRADIDAEYQELLAEIDRIAEGTEFNGIALTDGSTTSMSVQVGAGSSASNSIAITLGDANIAALSIDSTSVTSTANAGTAMTAIDTALDSVNGFRSDVGASQRRLSSAADLGADYADNLAAAQSSIRDVDMAYAAAEAARLEIVQTASLSVLAQTQSMSRDLVAMLFA